MNALLLEHFALQTLLDAEPRLAAVTSGDPFYGLARSLIDRLSLLLPIDASQVPPTSLLREFIGGSGFSY